MSMRLQDRVAIVTGAGRAEGIGFGIARLLAAEGATVAVNDVEPEAADWAVEAVTADGGRAFAIPGDIRDGALVKEMTAKVAAHAGSIDILINNAGVTQPIGILDMTDADWDRVISTNLTGTFLLTRAVLPHMIERNYGRIVCMSSVAGKKGGGRIGGIHYATSKAGLLGFTKALVREITGTGITANAICPGTIDTGKASRQVQWDGKPASDGLAEALKGIPVGRLGRPADVANAALFFALEESGFVTGEVMDVNGGAYLD